MYKLNDYIVLENPDLKILKDLKTSKIEIDKDGNCTLMRYLAFHNHVNHDILDLFENEFSFESDDGTIPLDFYLSLCNNINLSYVSKMAIASKRLYNNYNLTPLMYYMINCKTPRKDIIKFLSPCMGIRDSYGETALMKYIYQNANPRFDIIKLFKPEFEICNLDGLNPLHEYLSKNSYIRLSKKIIKLLKKDESEYLISYLANNKNPQEEIIYEFQNNIGTQLDGGVTHLMIYLSKNENPKIEIANMLTSEIGAFDNYGNMAINYYIEKLENDKLLKPKYDLFKLLKPEIDILNKNTFGNCDNNLYNFVIHNYKRLGGDITKLFMNEKLAVKLNMIEGNVNGLMDLKNPFILLHANLF